VPELPEKENVSMIAIVDYGVGNLFSLSSSLKALGLEAEITRDPRRLETADRIILPGVGAFGDARQKLESTGLVPVLQKEAKRKPLLGICLGMQLLFERSYEYGEHPGLALVGGEVADLRTDLTDRRLKVPHMGWNSLHLVRDDPLFSDFSQGEYVYYVHSFYAKQCAESTLATSRYGNVEVTGVVRNGCVWGTQFHPEKSGDAGLRLLRAFGKI
jgi:glutamine amidotransferase